MRVAAVLALAHALHKVVADGGILSPLLAALLTQTLFSLCAIKASFIPAADASFQQQMQLLLIFSQ